MAVCATAVDERALPLQVLHAVMAVLSELIEVHGELFSHSESAFASAKRQREVPETPNLMMQFHSTPEPVPHDAVPYNT